MLLTLWWWCDLFVYTAMPIWLTDNYTLGHAGRWDRCSPQCWPVCRSPPQTPSPHPPPNTFLLASRPHVPLLLIPSLPLLAADPFFSSLSHDYFSHKQTLSSLPPPYSILFASRLFLLILHFPSSSWQCSPCLQSPSCHPHFSNTTSFSNWWKSEITRSLCSKILIKLLCISDMIVGRWYVVLPVCKDKYFIFVSGSGSPPCYIRSRLVLVKLGI